MRVLTIFVRTGTIKYATAERELADLFQTQLPKVERRTVVVDTALPPCEAERNSHRVVIGGDNSAREFSALDSAVAYVGEDIWNYDLVNLTTAAFRQLYWDYLERFRPEVLSAVVRRPVCLGHIDCYNQPIEVAGCRSQHWMPARHFKVANHSVLCNCRLEMHRSLETKGDRLTRINRLHLVS